MRKRPLVLAAVNIALVLAAAAAIIFLTGDGDERPAPKGAEQCERELSSLPEPLALAPDFEAACPSPLRTLVPPRSLPYANGRIPPAYLRPIHQGRLLKDAAAAWNAMNAASRKRYGVTLRPLGGLSAYRDFAGQVYLYRTCSRAGWCAVPGRSNHGWGTTVDLATPQMRQVINAIGGYYGWAKRCSDASWEWWHIRWSPACTGARWRGRDPGPLGTGSSGGRSCKGKRVRVGKRCRPVLRRGSRGHPEAVRLVQRVLRGDGYCGTPLSGRYGRATRQRVKHFQRAHRIHADGVVGARTWRSIEQSRRHTRRCGRR